MTQELDYLEREEDFDYTRLRADFVNNVCRIGEGPKTCMYLMKGFLNTRGEIGFFCGKESVQIRKALEEKQMKAKGDNCSGPPKFSAT